MRDAPCQALGNGSFAHTGFTYQQGVVFAAAAENLYHTLDFKLTADQRVNLAFLGKLVQVLGVLLKRGLLFVLFATFFVLGSGFAGLGGLGRVALFDAVGNKIHDVKAGNTLLVQVIHGV